MAYGKIIKDLEINGEPAPYPVINERAIRASAGLMFAIGFTTFLVVLFTKNYMYLNIVVTVFWLDFFVRTVFQPHYSLFNFLGGLLVWNQKPEYVGVIQKRFAWAIGLALATAMIIGPVLFNIKGLMPISICSVCLFFMWMETALGICVGCNIYKFLLNKSLIKEPQVQPACPGGVCSISKNKK